MIGGECATGVIVNFRRSPHSKLRRSWFATASGAVASRLVRHLGEYIHVWKWSVKASAQGQWVVVVVGRAAKRWHVDGQKGLDPGLQGCRVE